MFRSNFHQFQKLQLQPPSLSSSLTSLWLKQHATFSPEVWFDSALGISLLKTLLLSCSLSHEKLLRGIIQFCSKGLLPLLLSGFLDICSGIEVWYYHDWFYERPFANKNIQNFCGLDAHCHLGCLFFKQLKNLKLLFSLFCYLQQYLQWLYLLYILYFITVKSFVPT